jgi:hypothetical protein
MTEDQDAVFRRMLGIFSPAEVASLLNVHEGTLKQWRYRGVGPSYVATERRVFYREVDLRRYFENKVVTPGHGPAPVIDGDNYTEGADDNPPFTDVEEIDL